MKGTGSIDKPPGATRFRLRMVVSGKRQTIGWFDTEEEAEHEKQAHLEALKETAGEFEGLTLADYGKKILTLREVKKLVKDPESDWSRWNHHVKTDLVSRIALRRLNSAHVHKWLGRLEKETELGIQTRRNCLNIVRVVLRHALEEGLIKNNPATGLRVRGKAKALDDFNYLQPPQQHRLLEVAGVVERHIIATAITCGFRAGEICTLRLDDVHVGEDEPNPHIVVRYGVVPEGPTKSGRIRTVQLLPTAHGVIHSWLQLLPKFCKKNPHGLLFPRERGGFRSEAHVIPWVTWKGQKEKAATAKQKARPHIPGLLELAGIPLDFRWHDLRHTCAASLASGWWGRHWSLIEIRDVLGHTDISTTQRYAHLAKSALEAAAAATPGRVSSGQRSLAELPEAPSPSALKQSGKALEPPWGFEPQTYGLRKPGLPQNKAGKRSSDPSLTRAPAPWVFEATANLYERLSAIDAPLEARS